MNKHIGSTLESLFDELGELDEFRARVKKVLVEDEEKFKMSELPTLDGRRVRQRRKLRVL